MIELLYLLRKEHIKYEIITVPFEFQKDSNKILRYTLEVEVLYRQGILGLIFN
jgi:hypothetical protein